MPADRSWSEGVRSVTNRNVVMFSAISWMVYLTEEQFKAELAARGGTPVFAASQDNQQ